MDTLIQLLRTDPNAANAFGALASAAATFLAVGISVVSLVVSYWALAIQRRHNRLSVSPLPEVTVADYEDSLRVKVRNNGAGPMIVKDLVVSRGSEMKSSLIEWMPPLKNDRPWNTFSHALKDRTLLPGHEIKLLELTAHERERGFSECREATRRALSELIVTITYTDVYESKFPVYRKALTWFGRHLTEV